jgi:membrane protein YdbS with pleckstrin-like domain
LQVLLLVAGGLLCGASVLLLRSILMWVCTAVFLGTAVLLGFVLLPLYFRGLECRVSDTKLTVCAGVFFRREQTVRLHSVQFVQLISGPFDGAWGMNFIILHLYGGQIAICFLHRRDYRELAALLEQRGGFHVP